MAAAAPAAGQDTARTSRLPGTIFVGSEAENYLRYLQTLGIVPAYPWSARGFSPAELDRLAPAGEEHPWAQHSSLRRSARDVGPVALQLGSTDVNVWYNSAFPFGMNDGAVWAGRGVTAAVQTAAMARWGPVSLTLAPIAFWSENREFDLMPHARSGDAPFADGRWPTSVDRPQRFGDAAYARLDAGQSTLRLDLLGVTAGLSTANAWWGPMSVFPYVLGNNASGFPHVFFGSMQPVNIGIGRLHGRVLYGRLEQSRFSTVPQDSQSRFASGAVVTFQPGFFRGLELGVARFFHSPWPDSGLTPEYFTHLFETFIKANIRPHLPGRSGPNQSIDNQLASIFGRWVLPGSGMEVYGEFGREDHNWQGRDIMVEPDHAATYGMGLRRSWFRAEGLHALTMEVMNFQASKLARHRAQGGIYRHTTTRQGHTQRGQLLASGFAVGSGAASVVMYEHFSRGRVKRFAWRRAVVQECGGTANPYDVHQVLSAEVGFDRGATRIHAGTDGTFGVNRNCAADGMNARGVLRLSWHP